MNDKNRDPIYHLDKNDYRYLITYMPEKSNYNGILFIMKEPDAGEDAGNRKKLDIISENNKAWFLDCIAGTDGKTKTDSTYQNRFKEMLKAVGCSDNELDKCAYANINPLGGGTSESKIYKNLINDEKEVHKRVTKIIEQSKPEIVFVCSKIYKIIKSLNQTAVKIDGLPYSAKKEYKAFYDDNNVKFYEIHHPIFSPRINI